MINFGARPEVARVLVVMAHPDDEALLCGGTLATLTSNGIAARVVCLSDGLQGREAAFSQACAALGAEGVILNHRTNSIALNGDLVHATDREILSYEPDTIITHTRTGAQSQDHVAVHDAVVLSVRRSSEPDLVLAAEPPIASAEFRPTVFFDIGDAFEVKRSATALYRGILDKPYMQDDYLLHRARWWAQVSGRPDGLCEAYELVLWR